LAMSDSRDPSGGDQPNHRGNDEAFEGIKVESKSNSDADDNASFNQEALERTHLHPQVCAECHDALLEERYRDIGRHRLPKKEGFVDKDCFLWNLTFNIGSPDADQQALTTAVENMDLTKASSKDRRMESIISDRQIIGEKESDGKKSSSTELDKTTGRNEKGSERAALALPDVVPRMYT
jgi:hypothetical protein